jgi:hypothetical protein
MRGVLANRLRITETPDLAAQGQCVTWAVSGVNTTTRRSKTYDNLIFDIRTTTEYTGRWGVLDLQNTFGLSIDKALEVSDHNPVWAAFRPWETRQVAGTPSSGLMQEPSIRSPVRAAASQPWASSGSVLPHPRPRAEASCG